MSRRSPGKKPKPQRSSPPAGWQGRSSRAAAGRRPRVLVNMAMSADGKIATANRRVSSFSSRADREHLLALRATADAVMAGARTVDSATVTLGPGPERFRRRRRRRGLKEYNVRVIVSGSGTVEPGAEIFRHRFSPILILTTRRAGARRIAELRKLADEVKICGTAGIDFRKALGWLRSRWGIRRLVTEGGGELNAALFHAGVVDELHLTVCPKLIGGRAAPTIADGAGALRLKDAAGLRLSSMRRIRGEVFLVYRAQRSRAHLRSPGTGLSSMRKAHQ